MKSDSTGNDLLKVDIHRLCINDDCKNDVQISLVK